MKRTLLTSEGINNDAKDEVKESDIDDHEK